MFDKIVSVDENAHVKLSTTAQTIGCAITYAVGMEDASKQSRETSTQDRLKEAF